MKKEENRRRREREKTFEKSKKDTRGKKKNYS